MTEDPELYLIDAFAGHPGGGNRAAVVLLAGPAETSWYAETARVLAMPATVFCWPDDDGFGLRWFAPSGELASCGHGLLAAAHALLPTVDGARISFTSPLGTLPASRLSQGGIEVNLPTEPLTPWQVEPAIAGLLGCQVLDAVRNSRHGLVRVADADTVRQLRPDLPGLAALPVVGLAVTAAGDDGYDATSRWFVPHLGLEDQATGTAHCLIGPYWAARSGRDRIRAYQASANGAEFDLRLSPGGLALRGPAVTLASGRLRLPVPARAGA